jgi:hypothetical protein
VTKNQDGHLGALALLAVAFGPIVLFRGWVLVTLWGWFMVPLGLPAMGLNTLVIAPMIDRLVRLTQEEGDKSPMTRAATTIILSLVGSLVLWAFGSIYAAFMP